MARVFVVEDELHAEWMGQFVTKEAALAYLDRLRTQPDSRENRAPCTEWRTCGRDYYLLEYEDSLQPWRKIASEPAFKVRGGHVHPHPQARVHATRDQQGAIRGDLGTRDSRILTPSMSGKNVGLELLPPDIAQEAVDLATFGVNEWAIQARYALTVCQILTNAGLAILGGDYWLRNGDDFQPASDGWAMREKMDEAWEVYVGRTLDEAERAMALRNWAYVGRDLYLVLVPASEEDYRQLSRGSRP